MDNKGLASIPNEFLALLVSAILIIFVFVLGITNYFDVKTVVRDFQTDRHTLDIAQALLSSDKLVYTDSSVLDNDSFHRALFDKEKLDDVLKHDVEQGILLNSKGKLNIAYPNSIMMITIVDLESEPSPKIWFDTVYGSLTYEQSNIIEWTTGWNNCLSNQANMYKKIDMKNLVEEQFKLKLGPWDIWDLQKCVPAIATLMSPMTGEKLENIWASKIPLSTKGFPVAIKDGDDVHMGVMKVWLIEV